MADPIDLSGLEAELARNNSVDASAAALIDNLLSAVEANKDVPAKIQQIVDSFRSSTDVLSAAVAKGTPADPDVEEPTEPVV